MGTRLSHVYMLASDLAATRRLLVDMLGIEVLMEHPGCLRIGGNGGFHPGIEEGDPGRIGSIELTIAVEKVDDAYRRLLEAGVEVEGPPADQEWGARHCWFNDGDGRRMSVYP